MPSGPQSTSQQAAFKHTETASLFDMSAHGRSPRPWGGQSKKNCIESMKQRLDEPNPYSANLFQHNRGQRQGPTQATFDQWANRQPSQAQRPNGQYWPGAPDSKMQRNITKGLFKFDGELSLDRSWESRIREHGAEKSPFWRQVLDNAEWVTHELKVDKLGNVNLSGVSASSLSSDLWSFLLEWLGPKLYGRRTKMSQDIEGNGLELRRRLFTQYQGSDELGKMAGRAKLLDYPHAKSMAKLNEHLDDWRDLLYKYGDELGPPAVKTLFLSIFADKFKQGVYMRQELKYLEIMRLAEWVRHQTMRERCEELAAKVLKSEAHVMALRGERKPAAPPPPRPRGGATRRPRDARDRRQPQARQPREQKPLIPKFQGMCPLRGSFAISNSQSLRGKQGLRGIPADSQRAQRPAERR